MSNHVPNDTRVIRHRDNQWLEICEPLKAVENPRVTSKTFDMPDIFGTGKLAFKPVACGNSV